MGQFAIDKLYTTILTTQSGEVPCAGENGELGKYALVSDIPKYYKKLKNQIDSICITGEFTPLTTTANISGFLLLETQNQKKEIDDKIELTLSQIESVEQGLTNINIICDNTVKVCNNKINSSKSELNELLNNYTTLIETNNNSEIITIKIDEINKQINTITEKYDSLISQNDSTINLVKNLEDSNKNTVEQVQELKKEVNKIINQNKEIMKFMLSIKTKIAGL